MSVIYGPIYDETEPSEVGNVIYGPGILYVLRYYMPKKGGTFHYCQFPVQKRVPKYDKLGRRTGRFIEKGAPCDRRFRKFTTYVRHWKRVHGGEWPS